MVPTHRMERSGPHICYLKSRFWIYQPLPVIILFFQIREGNSLRAITEESRENYARVVKASLLSKSFSTGCQLPLSY